MTVKPDLLKALRINGSRIDLVRPGSRGWRYSGKVSRDVFVFNDASYVSNYALNSDRIGFLKGPANSFNLHPVGAEAIESDLIHHGESLFLEFTGGLLDEATSDAVDVHSLDYSLMKLIDVRVTRLADLIKQAVVRVRTGEFANPLYIEGLVLATRALLVEAYTAVPSGELVESGSRNLGDTRIARAIDYAEAHLGQALTVADLAGVAALSPGHFSRTFKATTGEPVWAYVQRRRCERAMELLRTTRLPIAEIAYACGFANQAHFTTCFKQQFGATPGEARRDWT